MGPVLSQFTFTRFATKWLKKKSDMTLASPRVADVKISTASGTMLTLTRGYATKADWVAPAIFRPEETASFETSVYLSELLHYALLYTELTERYEVLSYSFYLE